MAKSAAKRQAAYRLRRNKTGAAHKKIKNAIARA
jgi:hypothetical protein